MRASAIVCLIALALLWSSAVWLWTGLPERFPLHFDASGTPDRWVESTALTWFLLPGLGTLLVALFSLALPIWIRRLAAANSPLLNVPRKTEFAALEPAARVRAVLPTVVILRVVGIEIALLFTVILLGSARVAGGAWDKLPGVLLWPAVIVPLGTALLSVPLGNSAVRRELENARP